MDYEEEYAQEYRTKEAQEWFDRDLRSNEEVMFDEIVADINEKLETANYYYKKTKKILENL